MRHRLFRKLGIRLIHIRHKCHSSSSKHPGPLHLSPLREMPRNHLLDIARDMYPAHIERPILSCKASHAPHIIPVITMLVPPKAVHVWIEMIV